MWETGNAINVKLEIPGMETQDMDIQVTEDTVYIRTYATGTGDREALLAALRSNR
ncbi:Hsp20 family protein [Anabaenopsis elenkinii]|uniref:Hsp20 family protein n=1 Tax=Anabaenopsis elenkinii CCIBt3563 TaxID=2779889 RepID=A0A7S6RGY2_9CYAN|nr:Hsp20 family protein [Anabaenopsis elenkinii]QOV24665.1 Hsp20 family protein [Anabaenopsis elenkinii CCIBt3563]